MTFGENLKKARGKKKMTQEQLAEEVDLSREYIAQLESGARSNPSMHVITKIATALGVGVNNLMK